MKMDEDEEMSDDITKEIAIAINEYQQYNDSNLINWTDAILQLENEAFTSSFTDKKLPSNNYKELVLAINQRQKESNKKYPMSQKEKNIKFKVAFNTLYLTRTNWNKKYHTQTSIVLSDEELICLNSITQTMLENELSIVSVKDSFTVGENKLPFSDLIKHLFTGIKLAETSQSMYSYIILY